MRCPRCGNEVSQQEAFCGQCGTPNTPPAKPTEMVSTPPPPNGRPADTYHPNTPFPPPHSPTFHPGMQSPPAQGSGVPYSPDGSFVSNQNLPRSSSGAHPQTGFYQDATEAMSILPANGEPGYHTGYQQQNQPGTMYPGYSTAEQPGPQIQPFQTGHYTGALPPQQHFTMGYEYGTQRTITPPPTKQSSGAVIAIICVCVVVALVGGIGATYFLTTRNSSSTPSTGQTPVATSIATTATTPTLAATPATTPTVTATPSPSPTAVPTPPPDAGFSWCATLCTPYSFSTEYPGGWQPGAAVNAAGVQFTNPAQGDQYASFKTPGQTASPAGDLVTGDLQTNFATRPGYTPPASTSTTTISGETWATAIAYYQSDAQQKERVEVFATVHQGKAYIIELQAPDSQFDAVNNQYFNYMLGRFQFLQAAS